MNDFYNNTDILRLISKWYKHLLVITGSAVLIAFIISLVIKPKFKSESSLYPSNLISYSSESPTEQMLQLFSSDDLKDSLIKKFKLTSYWEIDTTKKYYKTTLYNTFDENIKIRKGDNESVMVVAIDTRPDTACKMVSEMINFFNKKVRFLQKEKLQENAGSLKIQLSLKSKQIDSLEKRLDTLRKKYNILDYEIQLKEVMRQRVKEEGSRKTFSTDFLNNLKVFGGEYLLLSEYISNATVSYNKILTEYEKTISELNKDVTYTNIISSPKIPDKKCYPVRWLIVLLSAGISFIFSLLVIGIIENYKNSEQKK